MIVVVSSIVILLKGTSCPHVFSHSASLHHYSFIIALIYICTLSFCEQKACEHVDVIFCAGSEGQDSHKLATAAPPLTSEWMCVVVHNIYPGPRHTCTEWG